MKLAPLSVALALIAGSGLAVADDLDDSLAALKQAESAKDVAKVKQLAASIHTAAQKVENAPAAEITDKEAHEAQVDHAKEVDTYGEYAMFALAAQLRSQPPVAVDLISTLEKQNPKSKYLDEPEALEIQLDNAYSKKQTDRALNLANRLIAVGNRKPPEGVSASDWDARKNPALGQGYFMAGVIQADKELLRDADRNLRAALPLIKGNAAMTGPALFYLGLVNYKIGKATLNKAKMLEAVKFSQDAAAIPGPQQDQASRNAMNIKAEADRMR